MGKKSKKESAKEATTRALQSSPQTAPSAIATCPNPTGKREITGITMKRKDIHLSADDKYGHWWFEIDGAESYGWWPKDHVGLKATLGGTEGELNGQSNFGGSAKRDPHDGDGDADQEFHPVVALDDTRTDEQIKTCLRDFANAYSGEWRWTFGAGQNCHTFQRAAMKHCKLQKP